MSIYEQALQGFIGALIIISLVWGYRKIKNSVNPQKNPVQTKEDELIDDNDPEGLNVVRNAIKFVIIGFILLSIIPFLLS